MDAKENSTVVLTPGQSAQVDELWQATLHMTAAAEELPLVSERRQNAGHEIAQVIGALRQSDTDEHRASRPEASAKELVRDHLRQLVDATPGNKLTKRLRQRRAERLLENVIQRAQAGEE